MKKWLKAKFRFYRLSDYASNNFQSNRDEYLETFIYFKFYPEREADCWRWYSNRDDYGEAGRMELVIFSRYWFSVQCRDFS